MASSTMGVGSLFSVMPSAAAAVQAGKAIPTETQGGKLFSRMAEIAGYRPTLASGVTPVAAPVAPELPPDLQSSKEPTTATTLPTPDPTSLAVINANRRSQNAAVQAGRTSTILSNFSRVSNPPSTSSGSATGDYTKRTLASG